MTTSEEDKDFGNGHHVQWDSLGACLFPLGQTHHKLLKRPRNALGITLTCKIGFFGLS